MITSKNIREGRASTVKVKINGQCMNCCVFCPFNRNTSLLEIEDLVKLFSMLEDDTYFRIIINGGEPTIHPRFIEITQFLKERFKGVVRLELGTNLIALYSSRVNAKRKLNSVLETYDRIQVGCDDEHQNISHLENLAPILSYAEVDVAVNSILDYCSAETKTRLIRLEKKYDFDVYFSGLHHDYRQLPVLQNVKIPCVTRVRDLLVNCNGDVFFCYHQEHELPIFNLHNKTSSMGKALIAEYEPEIYEFCRCCERYSPESAHSSGD